MFYLQLIALSVLALCLIVLPIVGTHPPVLQADILAHDVTEYITSVVSLYDTSLNKKIYLLILLVVGVCAIPLFKRNWTHAAGSVRNKLLANSGLLIISSPVYIYVLITLYGLIVQNAALVIVSVCLAAIFTTLHDHNNVRQIFKTLMVRNLAFLICVLISAPFLNHLGVVPVMWPLDFIFNADTHLAVTIGPAVRLIDGYPWFSDIKPFYGLLMPKLTSWIFSASSFSIEKCMAYLQFLQVALVAMFAIAMYFRRKSFIFVGLVLLMLYFFDPASVLIYYQNHGAWRYLGVALVFFALSLGCLKSNRLHPLLKGGIGAISVLVNIETGLILTVALIGSELLAEKRPIHRTLLVASSAFALLLVTVFLITGESLGNYYYYVNQNYSVMNALGGEPYAAIPVFAVIVLHASIIVWRSVRSKIRIPHLDFDFVASLFCLGWSMYYVNRPGDTYLTIIFIVYSFVFMRLPSDIKWLVGNKSKLLSQAVVFLCMFSYFSFFVSQLNVYYERTHVRLVEVKRVREMDTLGNVTSSALELSRSMAKADGYITPFTFFVRGISGLSNNLTTQDPFSVLITEHELNAFLSGNLPKIMFMPRVDILFAPNPPPVPYQHFIDRVTSSLKARGYTVQRDLKYWTVFSQ